MGMWLHGFDFGDICGFDFGEYALKRICIAVQVLLFGDGGTSFSTDLSLCCCQFYHSPITQYIVGVAIVGNFVVVTIQVRFARNQTQETPFPVQIVPGRRRLVFDFAVYGYTPTHALRDPRY